MSTIEATTEQTDPTNCNRCRASLERGWSERWRNDKRVECVCFDCNNAEKLRDYLATGVLTSSLTMTAAIRHCRNERTLTDMAKTPLDTAIVFAHEQIVYEQVWHETEKLNIAARIFEQAVWFAGLQSQVRAATFRGFMAKFKAGEVDAVAMVYSLAGRTQITLEAADESFQISLITAEDSDEPCMGVNSINATLRQAMSLIEGVCRACRGGVGFERRDSVGVGL